MPAAKKPAAKKSAKKKRWTHRSVSRLMVRKARKRRRAPASELEKMVLGWLDAAGIPYRKQYPIGRCHVDILLLPDLIVEVNGCYWHAHQRCAKKALSADQNRRRAKDKRRYRYFLRSGYKLMLLWECDIHAGGENAVIAKIRRRLEMEYAERSA
jgi:DNA mismatch endonuclease (patch repair protein)